MKLGRHVAIVAGFVACGIGLSGCANRLGFEDADRLACLSPSVAMAPVPSSAYAAVSLQELESLARSGDRNRLSLAAARVLGERFEHGDNVPRDLNKALAWYRAAALILPDVHFIYMPGFGSVPGSVIAIGGAGPAMPGDPIAMQHFGELYRTGSGVPVNLDRANILLSCAAKSGVGVSPQTVFLTH